LYDEVTEDQYKTIVGKRLARDDFIEDDDGSGYADNGMDVWERTRNDSEEDTEDDDNSGIKRGEEINDAEVDSLA
jgi:DNA polymerase alpha subunit A